MQKNGVKGNCFYFWFLVRFLLFLKNSKIAHYSAVVDSEGGHKSKIGSPNKKLMCFFVFRYLELFSTHGTSNVSIYKYMY